MECGPAPDAMPWSSVLPGVNVAGSEADVDLTELKITHTHARAHEDQCLVGPGG